MISRLLRYTHGRTLAEFKFSQATGQCIYANARCIVMHLGVTNCFWGNLISGSVLNQSFSSGSTVMHLGPWGNSWFLNHENHSVFVLYQLCLCFTNHSTIKLNHHRVVHTFQWYGVWRSLDSFFCKCVVSGQLLRCDLVTNPSDMGIFSKWAIIFI